VGKVIEIKVPDIGDFRDVPVIEVLKSAGDHVDAEDSLVTLESDKATMEVPSPLPGVIREMRLKVNDHVSEGDVVAVLEAADEAGAANPEHDSDRHAERAEPAGEAGGGAESPGVKDEGDTAHPQSDAKTSANQQVPGKQDATGTGPAAPPAGTVPAAGPASVPYASPSVRKFARELGADLGRVKGTGNGGRILKADVTAFVKSVMTRPPAEAGSLAGFSFPPLPKVDFARFGRTSTQPLSRIRRLSSGFLHRNWVSIPHVTQHDEADITDMEAFRKAQSADAEKRGFKLTPLAFLIKACVMALREFPQFNASLDGAGENLILKEYFNIGVAVDTPEGLVVPVLRDCERKGLMELAGELAEVSARAREQKLKPDDIQGGCFSISSLGGIGGTAFTPIINAPEVAILGVSRSRMQPVWDGRAFHPRLMLPLSVSYDHRVIDGAAAARFTRFLASRLEDLRRLAL